MVTHWVHQKGPKWSPYSLLFILVEKREGERGEVWHLGGGCGLPETREEQCRPLPPQAQLDVPSCLPQIPKEKKVEKIFIRRERKKRVKELLEEMRESQISW